MRKLSNNTKRHVLLIGGMGPQASVYAHGLLQQRAAESGAVHNHDFPRVTHLSVNVRDFIDDPTYQEEALDYILSCLKEIDLSSVTTGYIVCNTAHVLYDRIASTLPFPLLSLIDVATEYVDSLSVSSVGLLATPTTHDSQLYASLYSKYKVVEPDTAAGIRIENIIRDVISGANPQVAAKSLKQEIYALKRRGAQKIILGCTELSLVGSHNTDPDVIDPLEVITGRILK
jgi:aspartate racemase